MNLSAPIPDELRQMRKTLTVLDVAYEHDVTENTVRAWCKHGVQICGERRRLKHFRRGRQIRIKPEDLLEFMRGQ